MLHYNEIASPSLPFTIPFPGGHFKVQEVFPTKKRIKKNVSKRSFKEKHSPPSLPFTIPFPGGHFKVQEVFPTKKRIKKNVSKRSFKKNTLPPHFPLQFHFQEAISRSRRRFLQKKE
jgi:hypothetical protein